MSITIQQFFIKNCFPTYIYFADSSKLIYRADVFLLDISGVCNFFFDTIFFSVFQCKVNYHHQFSCKNIEIIFNNIENYWDHHQILANTHHFWSIEINCWQGWCRSVNSTPIFWKIYSSRVNNKKSEKIVVKIVDFLNRNIFMNNSS